MENDKGLELSLGLTVGHTPSASNDRSGNSADDRTDDADERTCKILNDFRNFLNAGAPQSFQGTDPVKPPENFFNHIQRTASIEDDSTSGAGTGGSKRKSTFDESKDSKKQETESRSSNLHEKENNSHISITTDEGSTGDNEDVAESEADESTSRMVSRHDDGSRTPGASASSSQAPMEANGLAAVSASSLPMQTTDASKVPYSVNVIESGQTGAPNTSNYPSSVQNVPLINGNHITSSVPPTFAHSSIQIPDKGNPRGISRTPPLHSPYAARPVPTSVSTPTNPISSEATQQRQVAEDGSSSQTQGDAAAALAAARPSSFPSEYPAIRPGIAADVKFGGSGSFPNLPWVSTTGPGPNGKTICGVTYKFNATQIKIVCACHGIHLSPDEFVRHATEEQPSIVAATGLASLRSSSPATSSAKS